MTENQLTGIILSGGKSSRMGTVKGLAKFQGKPLISYAIKALEPIVDTIIIGANSELAYKEFGFDIVEDELKNIGPIGGILSTLRYSKTANNIILSCDMPYVRTDLLSYLYQNGKDYDVVVAAHGDNKLEPLCGFYSRNTIIDIEASIEEGNYKLQDFFNKVNFKALRVDSMPFYTKDLFVNINKPEDLIL